MARITLCLCIAAARCTSVFRFPLKIISHGRTVFRRHDASRFSPAVCISYTPALRKNHMEILARGAQRFGGLARWLCLGLLLIPSLSDAQAIDEYEVKAAFLYNFTKFVEWPKNDSDAFSICILGDDPFGPTIDQLVKGKTVNGKKLSVRRLKEAVEAKQCQIVYVRAEEKNKAAQLIEAVQKM